MPATKAPQAAGLLVAACNDPHCSCGMIMLHLTDAKGQALAEYRLQLLESAVLGEALLKEVGDQLRRQRSGPVTEIH